MTAWGEITGTLSNQTDLNTALAGKASTSNPSFTGDVAVSDSIILSGVTNLNRSDIFGNDGLKVGDSADDSSGHVAARRIFAGNQPGDNPQGASYADGVRITTRWDPVDPNALAKWQGLYNYNVLVPSVSTGAPIDLAGVNSQVTVFRSDNTAINFFQIYGGFFVGVHDTKGTVTGALKGVEGRANLDRGTATTVRGAMGAAVLRNIYPPTNTVVATTAYGVYGILRVENPSGTATTGAAVFAQAQENVGTITNCFGVQIANVALNGSGTNKIGLKIDAQTVATPANWTTVANIHSAGNVPNIFDGVIRSTRAQGSPPFEVASNTLVTNLNANMIEGQNLAALDARYAAMPKARQITANRYYPPAGQSPSLSSLAVAANTLYAMPLNTALEMNAVVIEVTAPIAASSARLGIYSCNAKGQPAQLIEEAATVSTASAGIKEAALVAARPIRQPVWLVVLCSHAVTLRTSTVSLDMPAQIFGATNLTTAPSAAGVSVAQAFGALPANFPAGATIQGTGYSVWARGT